jgi:hypothetical protein
MLGAFIPGLPGDIVGIRTLDKARRQGTLALEKSAP